MTFFKRPYRAAFKMAVLIAPLFIRVIELTNIIVQDVDFLTPKSDDDDYYADEPRSAHKSESQGYNIDDDCPF